MRNGPRGLVPIRFSRADWASNGTSAPAKSPVLTDDFFATPSMNGDHFDALKTATDDGLIFVTPEVLRTAMHRLTIAEVSAIAQTTRSKRVSEIAEARLGADPKYQRTETLRQLTVRSRRMTFEQIQALADDVSNSEQWAWREIAQRHRDMARDAMTETLSGNTARGVLPSDPDRWDREGWRDND